jgi:hypothetical protein
MFAAFVRRDDDIAKCCFRMRLFAPMISRGGLMPFLKRKGEARPGGKEIKTTGAGFVSGAALE